MPTFLGAAINDAGQIIFSPEPVKRKAFFDAVYADPIGAEFLKYRTPKSMARLTEILTNKFLDKGRDIMVDDAVSEIRNLLITHDPAVIPPPEPSAVVADTRARHADGTFKSEFETWASDPNRSMREIRSRAEREPAFREWFHSAITAQTIQDGSLRVAGAASRTPTMADHQLLGEFARLYRITPSSQLKPQSGFIKLGDRHYTPQEFETLISQAATAGLI
jgi:hypothetical protein